MASFSELASRVDAELIAQILNAKEREKTATWGYAKDGTSQVFHLAPGESLPEGFADSPAKWVEPEAKKPEPPRPTITLRK